MSARFFFAYAPEHDRQSYHRWRAARGLPWSDWRAVGPSILRDHDLVFPSYDERVGGGRASVRAVPGKRVAGVIYEVPEASLRSLDAFLADTYDAPDASARGSAPLKDSTPQKALAPRIALDRAQAHRIADAALHAVTFFALESDEGRVVPPAPGYIRELVEFGHSHGHSSGWTMHLLSIATTQGEAEPILYDI